MVTIQDPGQGTADAPALTEEQTAQIMARYRLEQRILAGANQFFWIAGLSLINSVSFLLNAGWTFFIGLAATQVIDGIASGIGNEIGEAGIVLRIIGLVIDLFVAGMFVFFGYFARKRHGWAFGIGLVLYALDGLVFLLVGDLIAVALHVYFLWLIFGGVQAMRRLSAIEAGTVDWTLQPQAPKRTWRDRGYWLRVGFFPAVLLGMLVFLLVWLVFFYPK